MENSAMVITKVKNIFIMLLSAISTENIDKVDHYLDDNMAEFYRQMIKSNSAKNLKQKYDMPNIASVEVVSETEDYVLVKATIKYVSYKINKKTNKVVEGNNLSRLTKDVTMKFKKQNVADRVIYRCPGCGSSLNLNLTSICTHCGTPVDERFSSLVLSSITPGL